MKTILALLLALAGVAARAQSPAANPMPDGSRDMYAGLGVVVAPHYQGAGSERTRALPLLQAEWSNGMFVSGMNAGWHLSARPDFECGPLLALDPGRDEDGTRAGVGGISAIAFSNRLAPSGQGLAGMRAIGLRLQAGAFANYYLTPAVRLSSSVLYGSGRERDGVVWNLALQRVAADLSQHHRVSLAAGLNLVNRSYNASFFGISADEAQLGMRRAYAPGGGVRDYYVGAGWNWALSPAWMVVSAARVARLAGAARNSPLVERPTNTTVSSGLVYRF